MRIRYRETDKTDHVELRHDEVQGPVLVGRGNPFELDWDAVPDPDDEYFIGPDTFDEWEILAPNGFFQASEISGTPQVHEKVRKKHRCDARFVLQSVHESANPGFSGKKCDCLLQDRISPWLFPWIFHLPVASCTLRML